MTHSPIVPRLTARLLLLAAAALPAAAQEFPATPGPLRLSEGDTLVFLGDSITHQCLYTQYVEDFVYTRFPRLRIHLHNAGVGGDTAGDALERFEEDVAGLHPAAVFLLLGMNDGRYTAPDAGIFDTYQKDMTRLLDQVADLGAQPILMAPTWFDQRTALRGKNWISPERAQVVHYNATLASFGAWLRDQAEARGLRFADLAAPLAEVTRSARRDDPAFTMIPDAVHPGPDGHLVMALALLEDLGFDGELSALEVFRQGGRWRVEAHGGTLSKVAGEKIRFLFEARGLPWVVPEDAAAGFRAA
ncbi:MAG: SGNH/GDSL hydrolase family protein, partial [Planctomycetota bacterium]